MKTSTITLFVGSSLIAFHSLSLAVDSFIDGNLGVFGNTFDLGSYSTESNHSHFGLEINYSESSNSSIHALTRFMANRPYSEWLFEHMTNDSGSTVTNVMKIDFANVLTLYKPDATLTAVIQLDPVAATITINGRPVVTQTASQNQIAMPSGSVANPSYSFVGDLNTGVSSSAVGNLSLVTGGKERAHFSDDGQFRLNHLDNQSGLQFSTINSDINNGSLLLFGGSSTSGGTGASIEIPGVNAPNRHLDFYTAYLSSQDIHFNTFNSAVNNYNAGLTILHGTGNVGIGVPTPSALLHIKGSNPQTYLQYTGTSGGFKTLLNFLDSGSHINAAIGNNLMDDSNSYAADLIFQTSTGGALNTVLSLQANKNVAVGNGSEGNYGVITTIDGNSGFVLNAGAGTSIANGAQMVLKSANQGGGAQIAAANPGFIDFFAGNSSKMDILANGNVGIGIPAPTARLHVVGNAIITQTVRAQGGVVVPQQGDLSMGVFTNGTIQP